MGRQGRILSDRLLDNRIPICDIPFRRATFQEQIVHLFALLDGRIRLFLADLVCKLHGVRTRPIHLDSVIG